MWWLPVPARSGVLDSPVGVGPVNEIGLGIIRRSFRGAHTESLAVCNTNFPSHTGHSRQCSIKKSG
jgi:hypothetical protein